MPRDELRQPLRKRSLSERLWAKRPGCAGHCFRRACRHGGRRCHLAVAHSPSLRRRAGCDRGHSARRGTEDIVDHAGRGCRGHGPRPMRAAETVLEAEEAPPKDYSQEAAIIMATHRPLQGRADCRCHGAGSGRTAAARLEAGPQALRCLCPGHAHRRHHLGPAQDRHPARRHGHQPAPDPEGDQGASGRHQLRLCALWREPAGAGQQGARRGSRGHASAADGTAGLSGNQSRSADTAVDAPEEENLKSLRWHAEPLCRLSPASPTTWAAGSWPYPTVWHR